MSNEQIKTNNKPEKNNKRKRKKLYQRTGIYYSFLTIVLVFCLFQIGYGALLNISKIISYQGKVITLENLLKKAKAQNEDLKTEKKVITSSTSVIVIVLIRLYIYSPHSCPDSIILFLSRKSI